ncbi:Hypothetical predicted protein [Octopus vulgaris]|uniref:Uncharacterized protein n=1 Tax=Octopus vulgaris TaxID=6645 RepID=A0AA36EXV8_OCTVU|nr:Hypothetical predicted protein [Octopus vulgaris]
MTDHNFDPFGVLELQKKNGIDIRIRLRSCTSATKIINGISINMKMKICQLLEQIIGKLSVLIEESTSMSIKIALKVYLSCESGKEVDPYFMVLSLIELPDQKTATISKHLLSCFINHEFDDACSIY